tara:strand:+ start:761 stop:2278 length:1518 start_codon:yes stop_codon:yes gene_type:complete
MTHLGTKSKKKGLSTTFETVLFNVCCSALFKEIYGLDVPAAILTKNGSYFQQLCGRGNLKTVLDWFVDNGYIELNKGFRGKGQETGVATKLLPTPKFLEVLEKFLLEPVVFETSLVNIKNDEGRGNRGFIREILKSEKVLSGLNNLLAENEVTITKSVGSKGEDAIKGYLVKNIKAAYVSGVKVTLPVLPGLSTYRRVYSGRFGVGGRLISGVQRFPKEERWSIRVGGDETCELDFKSLHPNLCYAMEGLEGPEDCYKIPSAPRQIAKGLLLIALNASSRASAIKAMYSEAAKDGDIITGDINKAYDELEALHAPIAHHFYTEAWKHLQHTESNIMLDVVQHFVNKGVICLGVHDSAIVPIQFKEELHEVMSNKFKKATGVDWSPAIDRKDEDLSRMNYRKVDMKVKVHEQTKDTWKSRSPKFTKILGKWRVGETVVGILEAVTIEKSKYGPKRVLIIGGRRYFESAQIKGIVEKIGIGKKVELSCTSYNRLKGFNIFTIKENNG